MANRPTVGYPEWANDLVPETVTYTNGSQASLNNKEEPSQEWKDSGELEGENLPRQYLNYDLDLINQWIMNFDSRFPIGYVFITANIGESVSNLEDLYGGTWAGRGTDTLGTSGTLYVFERTA